MSDNNDCELTKDEQKQVDDFERDRWRRCTRCGEVSDDVEERHSFGIYAGRLCTQCCSSYRDNCGVDQEQGRPEDLDEVFVGGMDAYDGEEGVAL